MPKTLHQDITSVAEAKIRFSEAEKLRKRANKLTLEAAAFMFQVLRGCSECRVSELNPSGEIAGPLYCMCGRHTAVFLGYAP